MDYMYMPLIDGKPAMWNEDQFVYASGKNPHHKVKLYEKREEVIKLIEQSLEWRLSQGFDAKRSDYGTIKVLKPNED